MLTTEQLFQLTQQLRTDRTLVRLVREELDEVANTPEYQTWANSSEQLAPFQPAWLANFTGLFAAGLARPSETLAGRICLAVRVNTGAEGVFLTDGVWVPAAARVFPFADEAESLVQLARDLGWEGQDTLVMDVSAGCGQGGLRLRAGKTALLDISPRALAYSALNVVLNERAATGVTIGLNDLRDGVCPSLASVPARHVLVLANVPFGLSSAARALPASPNGGLSGVGLQESVFRVIAHLRETLPKQTGVRALVLGLSAGNARENRWDLPVRARRTLASFGLGAHVHWHTLQQEGLLRVNGRRALSNPAPVRPALTAAATCQLSHPGAAQRAELHQRYFSLAQRFEAAGHPHLAYGILQLEMPGLPRS